MPHDSGRMWLTVAGPVIGLVGFAAALALGAWLFGWYAAETYVVFVIFGASILGFTAFMLLRQGYEREAMAVTLRAVETRVGGIVDSAMDPIVTVDNAQTIVLFNAAAEEVFGWPRDAILGQPLDRLIPAASREAHRAKVEAFGEAGAASRRMGGRAPLTALRANGEQFPIDASISHHIENGRRFFTVILRDITERVRAETLLARSEARLRGILDSAMDAIITIDEQQRVVMFNAAAETMFGWPQSEAIGASLATFLPPRFRDSHGEHVRRFGGTGIGSRRMGAQRLITGLRRDGEEFPIDASISQHTDGVARFYTVVLRDVTDRVAAEKALLRSKEELKVLAASSHQAREQEQHRIARELHDELGQSLTALKMMTVWVRGRAGEGDDELAAKLARMGALLDDTVAATRRISSELRPLILDDLGLGPAIESMVEQFTERTGVACGLTLDDAALELADAHKTAVFRIVQESLTNIAKHARATRVDVVIRHAEGAVTIEVRDDGVGFAPDDPQPKGSHGLLGLRERAYLLGGQVAIASAPGAGTTLGITLPLGAEGAAS